MRQETALEILKTGANVFLTGEPGSGKTHTVNAYVRYLREHDITPSITASTGIAATHVGGMTIHSWSGIGIRRALTDRDLDDLSMREPLVKRITRAKVLIIDEVSMLDGTTLAMVEEVTRSLRRSEEPFGGLQVVLVGDFFQLPPIAKMGEAPKQFAFESSVWAKLNPLVCYLSEQHRQDDTTFLATLGAIRRGDVDDAVYECLSDRHTPGDEHPDDVPHLFTHNMDVDRKNLEELGRLSGKTEVFRMLSHGRLTLVEQMKKGCLSPEELTLKEGAVVMFTKNNFDAGYVNGTLGVVLRFDEETGFPVVETRDGDEVTASPAEWAIEEDGKTLAKLNQIPLRLAWAITIHKSQGMSMDAAIMDLSRAFEYGQGYVALSRVRTLAGLHLKGINTRALEVHPLVLQHDRVFREASIITAQAFEGMEPKDLRLMHQNFVSACGGKFPKKGEGRAESPDEHDERAGKIHSREVTRALLEEGKSVAEIIALRGLTFGTIVKHIEELLRSDDPPDIGHLKATFPNGLITRVRDAFAEIRGTEEEGRLTPVKRLLNDEVSFEEIRLARLFVDD